MSQNLSLLLYEAPILGLLFLPLYVTFYFMWKKIGDIDKHLTNHVTGTERKISDLDNKIDRKIDKLDSNVNDVRQLIIQSMSQKNQ